MAVIMRISHAPDPTRGSRSSLSAPYMIRDGLDYVASPLDGTPYTSKRAYERHIKANGCEIAGNDSSITQPKAKEIAGPGGVAESLKQAWEQVS